MFHKIAPHYELEHKMETIEVHRINIVRETCKQNAVEKLRYNRVYTIEGTPTQSITEQIILEHIRLDVQGSPCAKRWTFTDFS